MKFCHLSMKFNARKRATLLLRNIQSVRGNVLQSNLPAWSRSIYFSSSLCWSIWKHGLCLYKPAVCKENRLRGFRQTIRCFGHIFGTFLLFLFKAHLVIFTVALFLVWLLVRLTRCARRCPTWNSVTKNREDFGGDWWQVSESRQKFIVYYSVALLVGANCQVIS